MKLFGIILVAVSFLAGSFVTVLDPREVNWYYMIPALLLGLTGLWLYRKAQSQESRAGDKLAGNMATLSSSLKNILRNLEELCARGEDLPVYEARYEIDRRHEHERDGVVNRTHPRADQAHVVIKRKPADYDVGIVSVDRFRHRADVGEQVGVGQHDTLGVACAARCVLEEREVILVERGRL